MLSIEIIKQHFVLNSLPRKNSYFFKFYYTIALLLNNIAPGDCKTKRWIYIPANSIDKYQKQNRHKGAKENLALLSDEISKLINVRNSKELGH